MALPLFERVANVWTGCSPSSTSALRGRARYASVWVAWALAHAGVFSSKKRGLKPTLLTLLAILPVFAQPLWAADLPKPAVAEVDFARDIQPVLQRSCWKCHGPEKQRSGFRLDQRGAALQGGELGKAILPGKSAESPLIRMVAGLEEGLDMPPEGDRLSPEEIGKLRRWIDEGAKWPADTSDTQADPTDWWSLRPLASVPVPTTAGRPTAWSANPIDAFVYAKLAEAQLLPTAEADRRTLIRRVYFDLLGLPPTPEEVQAFVSDTDPLAYEQLLERLLQSPQYGERWARHWLDLVHFAETHGNDQDRPRENAWPYRDYVIEAFNSDKPYARFVEEQIATDALFPDHPELTPALGLLAAGPWDESTLRDIREDTLDRQIGRYLDRDDIVTTVMSTFTSSTVHCARCHNHKFDPFSQADYYALQAVFAGTEKADKFFDADPAILARRIALEKQLLSITARDKSVVVSLWNDESRAAYAQWEEGLRVSEQYWSILTPSEVTAANGTVLVLQPDQSLLATGERPEKEVYTVGASLPAGDWTALRLEVLSDDSLPMQGPGRQENGNLHLSEIRVVLSADGQPASYTPVPLGNPTADFDQAGWGIPRAVDGDPATAWGIHPQVGQPHLAVFELNNPVMVQDGSRVRVTLDQLHGGHHTIGRMRLSVSRQPAPVRATPVPTALAGPLSKPASERTLEETESLELSYWKERTTRELAALPPPRRVFAGTCDFPQDAGHVSIGRPREVQILRRGEISQPLGEALPGTLQCVAGLESRFALPHPEQEATRRAALARWITDPQNPLTWRSIVNRVWHHHFGQGIVDTPSDYGRMGSLPSHPELLDWLAVHFRDNGGSLKPLHKLILTSATYRQAATHNPTAAAMDGSNRLLWRGQRHRLDAEVIRDSLLALNGRLDPTMGGPSVKQFVMTPGIHVTPNVDYKAFPLDDPANSRRSIYRFLFRTLPDPFMDALDCPAGDQLTPVRCESVTSLQALALLNNPFMIRQCEHLASRITSDPKLASQPIESLFRLALQREPSAEERAKLQAYADRHGLANACRLIVNSNEFLFVE